MRRLAFAMAFSIGAIFSAAAENGQAIYEQRCAVCHDHPQEQTPPKEFLSMRPHAYIVRALTTGPMQPQAAGLSAADIDAVAQYLIASRPAGLKRPVLEEPDLRANLCRKPAPPVALGKNEWNGWSPDPENTRFHPRSGLRAKDVPRLKPKWVFAYPGSFVYGPPSMAAGRVFLGTITGSVFSLDAKIGCTYWATEPGPAVKTAVSIGAWPKNVAIDGSQPRLAAYFGNARAMVYAVNAETGAVLWSTKVDEHAFATLSGSLRLYAGKLYVPIASSEGAMATRGEYSCCTMRGGLAVLDAVSGKLLWKARTIQEEPRPFKLNRVGTQVYGPAGASIWSPPTLDLKAAAVYGATGQSRTDVGADAADAVIAFDLQTGARRWLMQAIANDNWNPGCEGETPGPNCPNPLGPDADFGSPPLLQTLANGKRMLFAAQKSGMVHAMDPDANGKLLWRRNLAKDAVAPSGVVLRDRAHPGVVFGMAADGRRLYAAIADPGGKAGHVPLGVYALNLADGEIAWHTPGALVPACSWGVEGCVGAQRTAVTVIPDAVFAGSANGHVRAYAATDGKVIWDFDTAQSYQAVNGVKAQGGSVEGAATIVAAGMLYVMSGYASYGGGAGNALIAFSVDGR